MHLISVCQVLVLLQCQSVVTPASEARAAQHLQPGRGVTWCALAQADAVTATNPLSGTNGIRNTGTYVSSALGVRVSTPFFGTGFNACIGARAALM